MSDTETPEQAVGRVLSEHGAMAFAYTLPRIAADLVAALQPTQAPVFPDGRRHALYAYALCGARATLPDRAESEDCAACRDALESLAPEADSPWTRLLALVERWHARRLRRWLERRRIAP